MMRPAIVLRIAAATSALYAAGHASGYPWAGVDGSENDALLAHLRGYRFVTMGVSRTVWDFHVGFGWILTGDLALQAVLLAGLAHLAGRVGARPLRPVVAAIALANVVQAALVVRYFFLPPLAMALFVAACLVVFLVLASREPARPHGAPPLRGGEGGAGEPLV